MALVHDVAEAYAGDTTAFASAQELAAHKDRERQAINKLGQDWPGFTSLHELIEEYEKHETPEVKFVYALDKLISVVNNLLYEGKVWKKEGRTLMQLKQIKEGKVEMSPEVNNYYNQILAVLEKRPDLFVKTG